MAPKKASGKSGPTAKSQPGGLRITAATRDNASRSPLPSPKPSPRPSPRPGGNTNGTDSSQLGKPIAPPATASTGTASLGVKSIASIAVGMKRPKFIRKAFPFTGMPQFTWNEGGKVEDVEKGGQADQQGIAVGWKIVEIGGESIKRFGDNESTRYRKRIAEAIRLKSTYHGAFYITFVFPAPPWDEEAVQQQETILDTLGDMSQEKRNANLVVLEQFNEMEKINLLQRPKACNALLEQGFDELTVLFGEKSAAQVNSCRNAWQDLQSGKTLDSERLDAIDLEYTDAQGDTPLHMVFSSKASVKLLQAALQGTPDVLKRRNKRGERPLEAMLRRAKSEEDRTAVIQMYRDYAPEALKGNFADGRPMGLVLQDDERRLLPEAGVPWEDVRSVLVESDLQKLQRGYAELSRRICASRSDMDPSDHVAVWSALLSEYCFGCLGAAQGASGASECFVISDISRNRLEDVWSAAKLFLVCSADERIEPGDDLPGMPNTALKGVARGLLGATMGPLQANFDPRETYRERIVELVYDLQLKTAARLKQVLDDRRAHDPEAAAAVENEIPANALHNLVPSGATVRGAPERIRLDARLQEVTEDIAPVPTPEWVLAQQIDMGMVEALKNADCIKKARDLCDLVETKSKALSPERLRFACLHVAWVWSFCGQHLHGVNSTIREKLGLSAGGEADKFPCQGSGDFIIWSFRARHEPKGLPRLLEKTQEAIEEEVVIGRSAEILKLSLPMAEILKLEADTTVEPEDLTGDQLSLIELLTPGCYVCDILGAEVSVETFKGMLSLYRKLTSMTMAKDGLQVVRTKNGFSKDSPEAAGGYKDLKMWVMVSCEGRTVVAELQVHIHSVLEQKKFMHLSYECFRGSFDHPHLQATWLQKPKVKVPKPDTEPEPPKGCCASFCAALSGKNSKVASAP